MHTIVHIMCAIVRSVCMGAHMVVPLGTSADSKGHESFSFSSELFNGV